MHVRLTRAMHTASRVSLRMVCWCGNPRVPTTLPWWEAPLHHSQRCSGRCFPRDRCGLTLCLLPPRGTAWADWCAWSQASSTTIATARPVGPTRWNTALPRTTLTCCRFDELVTQAERDSCRCRRVCGARTTLAKQVFRFVSWQTIKINCSCARRKLIRPQRRTYGILCRRWARV